MPIVKIGVLAGVDELARVHALVRDERLIVQFEAVWVAEGDFAERCAAAWIVDDLFDYTTEVAVAFGIVEGSELRGGLVQFCACCQSLPQSWYWCHGWAIFFDLNCGRTSLLVCDVKIEPRPFL